MNQAALLLLSFATKEHEKARFVFNLFHIRFILQGFKKPL